MSINALESQGVKLYIEDLTLGSPPDAWRQICDASSFDGPGGSAAVIDVSDLCSVAKEKRTGLPDEGQFTLSGFYVPADPAHALLREKRRTREPANFRIEWPLSLGFPLQGAAWEFTGFVLGFSVAGGVDEPVTMTVTIEISGEVTEIVNAAPVWGTIPAQSDAELSVINFDVSTYLTDDGNPIPPGTVEYTASGLPDALTIALATGIISGTISAGESASSPFTVTVTADDGEISVDTTFTWTVTP